VALGRPILAVRYPQLLQFASFVTFYDGSDDLVQRLRDRSAGIAAAASIGQREAWLLQAKWSERARAVASLIEAAKPGGNQRAIAELTQ
jgi:hypothetical protein